VRCGSDARIGDTLATASFPPPDRGALPNVTVSIGLRE
jgi:hypothetical protein